MRALLIIAVFGVVLSAITAQATPKPGQCPPPLPVETQENECKTDNDCKGIDKCCGTKLGGAVCTFPVSIRRRVNREKPGFCPNPPTGPWVCSSTCNVDVECRGRAKCCRNRCGALACTNPQAEAPTAADAMPADAVPPDAVPADAVPANAVPAYAVPANPVVDVFG